MFLFFRPFLSRIRSNDFFALLAEGSMSLSARRAVSQGFSPVSQRSGLSAKRSNSEAVKLITIALEYG